MKKIKINPFPNFKISDKVIERDVKPIVSTKRPKLANEILMSINQYHNGEKRLNFFVPEKKDGKTYLAVFPDPIQLYYSQSLNQYNLSLELRNKVFSSSAKKISDKEEYLLDSNSDNTSKSYNTYLQYRIGAIIMLTCSIEAFVNSMIPNDITYLSKKGEELDKFGIQRYLSLKEKMENVIPKIIGQKIEAETKILINRINTLSRVRNEFVHLKNYNDTETSNDYHKLFMDMKKFDILVHLKSVRDYMNNLKPNFIIEEI